MRLVLVGSIAVMFGVLAAAGCQRDRATEPMTAAHAASPQRALLEWVETFSAEGGSVTYRVHSFAVTRNGWRAEISMTNGTEVGFAVGDPAATLDRVFGVMLFRTGNLEEVERRNADGTLPTTREATVFDPALPLVLEPDKSWRGVMSAPGSLAAGRFVRVVFGALIPVGETPKGFYDELVWITDSSYELLP